MQTDAFLLNDLCGTYSDEIAPVISLGSESFLNSGINLLVEAKNGSIYFEERLKDILSKNIQRS